MRKGGQDKNKTWNELARPYGSFWYSCRSFLVHTNVSRTILDQQEVITWQSCDRPLLKKSISFIDKRTHEEYDPEIRFWISTPRAEETDSQLYRSKAKFDHYYASDYMTHNGFFLSFNEGPWKIKWIEDFRPHFRSLCHFRFVQNPRNREF